MDDTSDVDVLLVEDDEDLRDIGAMLLEAAGLSVAVAGSGDEALEQLARLTPRVLITDQRLPGGLGGLELALAIRALLPDLPLLAVSGSDDLGALRSAGIFELVAEKSQGYPLVVQTAQRLARRASSELSPAPLPKSTPEDPH